MNNPAYRINYDDNEVVSYRMNDLPTAARFLAEWLQRHDVIHALGHDDSINTEFDTWMDGIFAQMAMDTILDLVNEGYKAPTPLPDFDNAPF